MNNEKDAAQNPGLPPDLTAGGPLSNAPLAEKPSTTAPEPSLTDEEQPRSGPLKPGTHPSIPEGQTRKLPGYALKSDVMEFTLGGVTYKNGALKHHAMLTLMNRDKKWFRQSVERKLYAEDDQYWLREK